MPTPTIRPGDTIGVIAPCHAADAARYRPFLRGIRALGFQVREGANLYKATYGYGHGERHAILPIGRRARLDADQGTLTYIE